MLIDFNFNEWKELGGGGFLEFVGVWVYSDNKDFGFSSLEFIKVWVLLFVVLLLFVFGD